MRRTLIGFLSAILISSAASAETLIAIPEAAITVISPQGGTAASGIIGDSSVLNPTWSLEQWGSPQSISGSQRFAADSDWTVTSGSDPATNAETVGFSAALDEYVLQQNMQSTNTSSPNYHACGAEADLFMQNNGQYDAYGSTQPLAERFASSALVGSLHQLAGTVRLTISPETVGANTCASPNYASYGFNLILHNVVNGETLFYQIELRDSRGVSSLPNPIQCGGYPHGSPAVYCVTYLAPNLFGGSMQQPNTTTDYNMNLLTGLLAYIRAGYNGMDQDPNDWIVTGFYCGQGGDGTFSAGSAWEDVTLSAY
jgi:hypothetical protein